MKICPRCHREYDDGYFFCNMCGASLVNKQSSNKKQVYIIIAVVAVIVIALCTTFYEQYKIEQKRQAIEDYKYEKAMEEYRSTPRTSDLSISSDWTSEKSGNYIYIKGSVTNTSPTRTISYFEIEAKFYDSKGNMLDSDWTNDGDDLEPGETRKFEIMHKYDSAESNIKLSVKDVR